jgi:hypothetical protein
MKNDYTAGQRHQVYKFLATTVSCPNRKSSIAGLLLGA